MFMGNVVWNIQDVGAAYVSSVLSSKTEYCIHSVFT
jgi:hypothetical protein